MHCGGSSVFVKFALLCFFLFFFHMIGLYWFPPDPFILILSPFFISLLYPPLLSHFFVFSCMQLWRLPFAQVLFDSDPSTTGKTEPQQVEEMSQAMIRWVGKEEDH